MKERNKFTESDGLVGENEIFEFFRDRAVDSYAKRKGVNVTSLIARNKESGEYTHILVRDGEVIMECSSVEDAGVKIDMLKIMTWE